MVPTGSVYDLSSVTKPYTFPLSQIDDLLNLVEPEKCFWTVDLVLGY